MIASFLAAALLAGSSTRAHQPRFAHTKAQAERNVLRITSRSWSQRRIAGLIDPRTRLLRNNVQAICTGRGLELRGGRYGRFICTLRLRRSSAQRELYVTYQALTRVRFRVHWL